MLKIINIISIFLFFIPIIAGASVVSTQEIEKDLDDFAKIICEIKEYGYAPIHPDFKMESKNSFLGEDVYLYDSLIYKKRVIISMSFSRMEIYYSSSLKDRVEVNAGVSNNCLPNNVKIIHKKSVDQNLKNRNAIFSKEKKYVDDAVRVAIIDNGFDLEHEDFASYVLRDKEMNFIFKDERIGDEGPYKATHGIHVAGIASGMDREIAIVPMTRIDDSQLGAGPRELVKFHKTPLFRWVQEKNAELELEGMKFAVNKGVRVVNMSFGTPSESLESSNFPTMNGFLQAFIDYPQILFVIAAGNDSRNIVNNIFLPASVVRENLIKVASVNSKGELSHYSNYGKNVDLAALGEEVNSYDIVVGSNRSPYTLKSGTSMAAPLISHYAAKVLYTNRELGSKELKEILCKSVVKTEQLEKVTRCGGYFSVIELKRVLAELNLNPIN